MIYLLVVDVSSQVAGPGTILGAGALTYHKILIYNTILTCPKQLKSHIDTATKTCGKSSTSQCKHAHSSTSMLHCPHASARETQPSDWVCGTCNTKRHGRAGRRQHRIVRVDGHAQARSGRTTRCFLTCQASAHRCGERGRVCGCQGGMRSTTSATHLMFCCNCRRTASGGCHRTCIETEQRSGWVALRGSRACARCNYFNTSWHAAQ